MRHIINTIIGFGIILAGCDNRQDPFVSSNQLPSLTLKNVYGSYSSTVTDTVKVGIDYSLIYKIDDEDKLLAKAEVVKGDVLVKNITDSVITLTNFSEGENQVRIYCEDVYKRESSVIANFLAQKNTIPVCKVTIEILTGNIYKIDASESYDSDSSFGGKVVEYGFTIDDDDEIITSESVYSKNLSLGSHQIKVRCKDNNGEWSLFYKYPQN